jgi:hypothetical protein
MRNTGIFVKTRKISFPVVDRIILLKLGGQQLRVWRYSAVNKELRSVDSILCVCVSEDSGNTEVSVRERQI